MKKWTAGLLSVILVMGITACSKDKDKEAESAATPPAAEQPAAGKTDDAKTEAPSVDELIQKSAEASQKMKSFSMDSDIKQNIVVSAGESKQEQKVNISMKIDTTLDPLEMYQEMKMEMPGQGTQDIKQYITQKGIYSQVDGQWVQIPKEQEQEILDSMKAATQGPEKQLEQFKTIAKDAKVSEEGDQYILTADVSGDNLKELAKTYMGQAGGADEQTAAMLEQMNIKSMKITIGMNKDTYFPTKTDMNMVMEMEQEGQKVSLEMEMTSGLSKHNEIDKIEVPQEALDSAN
ncbi:hypothetical protein SAMN05661091_5638 [Paenibacillus uliginis N3/975]|uniref:Lipoprotein n=1 Tax=Paenibacillus uliginis N3/975 TaxID=1313296 RepID=A0A1X7HTW6_9BACL|nr:DUF6612 family protein [Paenibacillus uliginis]SMF91983.1 hypothetical protein SAMN05661091_5638 [Paenibacillus uliginis N3/975]